MEIDHQKQINQHHGQRHAAKQSGIALVHGFHLAAKRDFDGCAWVGTIRVDDVLQVLGDCVQIAALYVGINIKYGANIQL